MRLNDDIGHRLRVIRLNNDTYYWSRVIRLNNDTAHWSRDIHLNKRLYWHASVIQGDYSRYNNAVYNMFDIGRSTNYRRKWAFNFIIWHKDRFDRYRSQCVCVTSRGWWGGGGGIQMSRALETHRERTRRTIHCLGRTLRFGSMYLVQIEWWYIRCCIDSGNNVTTSTHVCHGLSFPTSFINIFINMYIVYFIWYTYMYVTKSNCSVVHVHYKRSVFLCIFDLTPPR